MIESECLQEGLGREASPAQEQSAAKCRVTFWRGPQSPPVTAGRASFR